MVPGVWVRVSFWGVYGLLLFARRTIAFPNGAGGCPGGVAAVGGNHRSSAVAITTGSLEENNLQLEINGQILQPRELLSLKTGVEHSWRLSSTAAEGDGFRGFLIRLGGGPSEVDTTVALSSASIDVQEAFAACVLAQGVGGVTHNENALKRSVTGILRLDEVASNLPLDTTVVIENRNGLSVYYYSAYALDFREEPVVGPLTAAPTRATPQPTSSPSPMPSTTMPTQVPSTTFPTVATPMPTSISVTPVPTFTPATPVPTQTPTQTQTISPSDIPSVGPSVGPSTQPSQQPTNLRTGGPSSGPTLFPTIFSTLAPTFYPVTPSPSLEPTLRPSLRPSASNSFDDLASADEMEPFLTDVEGGCSAASPCMQCHGDCDKDEDCEGSLKCYRRPGDHSSPVPGCATSGTPGTDYCYEPSTYVLRLRTPRCSLERPCEVCEGDCDGDRDCRGSLKCFRRAYLDVRPVPGCDNLGIEGLDYCYDEKKAIGITNILEPCLSDEDCKRVTCQQEPCLKHVCRNLQCIFIEPCGDAECGTEEYCCNPTCSICATKGTTCNQNTCEKCGDETCNPGDICCGENCGICSPPGGSCPQVCSSLDAEEENEPEENEPEESEPEENEPEESEPGRPINDLLYCESEDDCVTPACSEEPCLRNICRDFQCTLVKECGSNFCSISEFCCDEASGVCSERQMCNGYWVVPEPPATFDEDTNETDEAGGDGTNDTDEVNADQDTEEPENPECRTTIDCPVFLCTTDPCPRTEVECRDFKCVTFIPCGPSECAGDEVCCCETCLPPGTACDNDDCVECGAGLCLPDQVCCNPSCSICTARGGFCSAVLCSSDADEG
eukprot:Sro628_g178040.1 n/a (839) ;mRNA; r:20721-23488